MLNLVTSAIKHKYWSCCHSRSSPVSLGAVVFGALALGAFALGALALGGVALGIALRRTGASIPWGWHYDHTGSDTLLQLLQFEI